MVQASVRWISLAKPQLLTHYFLFPVAVVRLALRPFTFSNGVTVPAGALIALPSAAVHMDGEIFPNAEKFDGFRYAKLRERDGDAAVGHQATSTSAEHLNFGYGRHAWYVCFFAWSCRYVGPIAITHILYQPWSILRGQRGQGLTCTHPCNV